MPDVAVPAPPALSNLRRVEFVQTGDWIISSGRWKAARDDLVAAVAAMDCPAVRSPIIKLGHSQGEEPLWQGNPTGAPAIGWIDSLALTNQGHTLVGDFVGMPGWLATPNEQGQTVIASAWPDRSVEGKYDFRCQIGHTHPFVLTAVALLGVTPPGVGTLRSLQDVGRLYGVDAGGGTVVAFDPNQPRDDDGRWTDLAGVGGIRQAIDPAQDKLGIADRIPLRDGERLVASRRVVPGGSGEGEVALALTDGPDGPQLRLGVVPFGAADPKARGGWSAANLGGTARLDAGGVELLRQAVVEAADAGQRFRADFLAGNDTSGPLGEIAEGVIPGAAWGDVEWSVFDTGGGDGEWELSLRVRGDGTAPSRPGYELPAADFPGGAPVRRLAKTLDDLRQLMPAEVVAHLPGRHNQQTHGRRYGPDGNPLRRLTRGGRRNAVRTLNRVLREIGNDEAAIRPGMSGGPLVDLVRGIRDGVDGGQFTPDQALQLLSSLVFRPDVASNPRLSTALAEATSQLQGVQAAADWDPADHPRNPNDGRFVEQGAFARAALNLADGDLDVDDVEGGQVRLGLPHPGGGRTEAILEPDAADDLIDALREGLDDGFQVDVGGAILTRDGDGYDLDLGDDNLPLTADELAPLADALAEARAPRVTVETDSTDLRAKVDQHGDINLRFDAGETDLSQGDVQELVDGLDALLDTDIPDDAAAGDLISSFALDSDIELSLYGNGSVSIGWDTTTDRVEIDLDPDDVEPVRDALQQVVDQAGDFVFAAVEEPALRQVAAAADVRTGAMVALLPSEEDANRLAVNGGEGGEQLHATVLFLGDADAYPPKARRAVAQAVRDLAEVIPPGEVDGMAIAAFNPHRSDKDTCIVLELGGDGLEDIHGLVEQAVSDVAAEHGLKLPEQHAPYRPHVTLLYSNDLMNVPKLADRAGPVRLDRIRVAFAGENVDIPLAGETDTDLSIAARAGGDRPLRDYWLYGRGAVKIRWRTPGDFTRCVRQLREHVRDPEGLCAEYHFEANGFWPGDRRNLVHAFE